MRILHYREQPEHNWIFHVAPARGRTVHLVVCGSLLVSHSEAPAVRTEHAWTAGRYAAPVKAAGDLLVFGTAWSPHGRPTPAMRVGIAMGAWRKELAVFGDRLWEGGPTGIAATRPAPFESMPVTYERAFGGPGYRWNPIGRGMGGGDRGALLPNIEHPDRLIAQPTARPEPAGFGPIDAYWRPRVDQLGSFGGEWLRREWPGMPDDFDPRHWNEAPADQQFPGGFRGDERFSIFNMHPERPRVDVALPGQRPRAFLARTDGSFAELPLRLDTIVAEMDGGYTEAVWRGAAPVSSPRMREVAFLFTMVDELEPPAPDAACRALFERRRLEDYPDAEEFGAARAAGRVEAERAAAANRVKRDREDAAFVAEAEALLAAAEQDVAAARAETAGRPPTPAEPDATLETLREHDPAKAAEYEALMADADTALAEADPAPWTRDRVVAAHREGQALPGADLAGLDLSGLALDGAAMPRADLTRALLSRCTLRGADLTGAMLEAAEAAEADFTKAQLGGAVFRGAGLVGARFAAAVLAKADFSHAAATDTVFDGATGVSVRFVEADLSEASFLKADLLRADFSQAKLTGAVFDGASLREADLEGAVAPSSSFVGATLFNLRANGADLRGAAMGRAEATHSVWQRARLDGADLSGALLSWAIFAEAVLDGATLDRAWLDDAKFDEASLRGAALTRAKLVRTSFEWADLSEADLTGSNLWRAGLYNANLAGTRLDGCFLAGTLLQP